MARANPTQDEAFEVYVRENYYCVVNDPRCDQVEFSHLKHAGMGSKLVASYGNGVPMCHFHHVNSCEAFHKIGRQTFERLNDLDLKRIAWWLCRAFDGDFLLGAETPPKGVHPKGGAI